MPTVRELTALYEELLLAPRHGHGVCTTCFTFTEGYEQCYVCANRQPWLDAVAPISYSVALEQLHHTLASYKRLGGEIGQRLTVGLAAILWRYLDGHESCVATAAGVARGRFDLVTTVPAGRTAPPAGGEHPLEQLVGRMCGPVRERYSRVLGRAEPDGDINDHQFVRDRYCADRRLDGQSVLLIDDTWTTGASAQSAAAALKRAGARRVAAVVIGRHVKREWRMNEARLRATPHGFSWDTCVCCGEAADLPVAAGGGA